MAPRQRAEQGEAVMSRFRSVWRNLVHRRRVERDLDDELRGILELLVEEKVRGGLEPARALSGTGWCATHGMPSV